MYLIAGLGNPGKKYHYTRHNFGFLTIDAILNHSNFSYKEKFLSQIHKEQNIIYAKPQTFMNLSGQSIVKIASYYNIKNNRIIILHDDINLKFGCLKFKIGGSSGGHNGLKSIDKYIGNDYIRIRAGIGNNNNIDVSSYVLSNFSKKEIDELGKVQTNIKNSIIDLQTHHDLNKIQSMYTLKVLT